MVKKVVLIFIVSLFFLSCPAPTEDVWDLPKEPSTPVNNNDNSYTDFDIYVVQENSSVKIGWKRYGDDSGYRVYIKNILNEWIPISNVITDNTYNYSDVELNRSYFYGVREVNQESIISTTEPFALTSNIDQTVSSVSGLKTNNLQYTTGVQLTWNVLRPGVTYHIYRSEHDGEVGSVIGVTTDTAYFDDSSVSNIFEGKIYYYSVLWSEDVTILNQGADSVQKKGFFYHKTDGNEPHDNDKANALNDTVLLDLNGNGSITQLLYKFDTFIDTDWIMHTVPPTTSHVINIYATASPDIGVVEIFDGSTSLGEFEFPLTEYSLDNITGENKVFYFKVMPNNRVALPDFINEYTVEVKGF